MKPRNVILAAAALVVCATAAWRWETGRKSKPASPALEKLDRLEASADWGDPKAQAGLAIALVTEARRTQDPALWDRAALAAQRALAKDPERMDAKKVELLVMQNQHRFQELKDTAQKLLAERPHDGFLAGLVGDAELELGQYKEAEASYQAMVDDAPNAATYGRIAYLRMLEGDLDGAVEMGQLAARSAPPTDDDAVAWALCDLADVLLARNQVSTAGAYFDTALLRSPTYARAFEGRGHVLRSLGRLPEAVKAYQAAVEAAPSAQHRMYLAEALEAAGRADDARAEYARAEETAGSDARTLASLLLDQGKEPARALELAQKELSRRQDLFTQDVAAYALLKNGRLTEAARLSGQAMRLGTRDARLSFHAAAIAEAQGDLKAARGRYEEALVGFPALPAPQLEQARRFLNEHKSNPSGAAEAHRDVVEADHV